MERRAQINQMSHADKCRKGDAGSQQVQLQASLMHLCRLLLIFLASLPLTAPGSTAGCGQTARVAESVSPQVRQEVIESVAQEIRERYVNPERAGPTASHVVGKLRTGTYDSLADAGQFATAVTNDLKEASSDRHLALAFDPPRELRLLRMKASTGTLAPSPPPTAEEMEAARRSNFGFVKAEILQGNVGYLDLRTFLDSDQFRQATSSALGFLANSDALILDLRRHDGGHLNAESFFLSHFFGPSPVELFTVSERGQKARRRFALTDIPGKRLPEVNLYILVNASTASAAEATALTLQQLRGATVIGERTLGDSYGTTEVPVGHGFVLRLSTYYQFDPRTGRGWEGRGVEPDVIAPAQSALDLAHLIAVMELAGSDLAENSKSELAWLVPLLQLKAEGPQPIPSSQLKSYTGKFEQITIGNDKGRLFMLEPSGVSWNLVALSDDIFLIEDLSVRPESQARIRFIRKANGRASKLWILAPGGRVTSLSRTD